MGMTLDSEVTDQFVLHSLFQRIRTDLNYRIPPASGAVFSTLGHNHVGIVIAVDGDMITIPDGNLDGISNTFLDAMTD